MKRVGDTPRGTHVLQGISRTRPSSGDCFRCRESWSLGVEARNGAANCRRSDASRIRHGETGRLATPRHCETGRLAAPRHGETGRLAAPWGPMTRVKQTGASSTRRCGILPRRCGGAGSSTSSGDFGFGQFSRPHPCPDYGIIYPNVRFFEEENQEADRVQAGGPLRFAQKHRS